MSTRDPYQCPFSLDPDATISTSVSSSFEGQAHVSFFEICWVDGYYEFEIEEIILNKGDDRWQVVDWSEVLERK